MGYPPEILDLDVENNINLCLNASLFDADNGIILKLVEGAEITRAFKGFKCLSKDEIIDIYGSPPIY